MKNSINFIDKIISGGQTGADKAALDVAIALGIEHGGWCPKGRINEAGRIPSFYNLTESSSNLYQQRTSLNVKESDSTLIIIKNGKWGKGTLLTRNLCESFDKKYFIADVQKKQCEKYFEEWLNEHAPKVLNIAGNRESTSNGIYDDTVKFLLKGLNYKKGQ